VLCMIKTFLTRTISWWPWGLSGHSKISLLKLFKSSMMKGNSWWSEDWVMELGNLLHILFKIQLMARGMSEHPTQFMKYVYFKLKSSNVWPKVGWRYAISRWPWGLSEHSTQFIKKINWSVVLWMIKTFLTRTISWWPWGLSEHSKIVLLKLFKNSMMKGNSWWSKDWVKELWNFLPILFKIQLMARGLSEHPTQY